MLYCNATTRNTSINLKNRKANIVFTAHVRNASHIVTSSYVYVLQSVPIETHNWRWYSVNREKNRKREECVCACMSLWRRGTRRHIELVQHTHSRLDLMMMSSIDGRYDNGDNDDTIDACSANLWLWVFFLQLWSLQLPPYFKLIRMIYDFSGRSGVSETDWILYEPIFFFRTHSASECLYLLN